MDNKKKIAVILSGCGVFDGSEIHEATLALYAIMKNGGNYDIFAPDINQKHVINHLTGDIMEETRNVLVESARIARGKIKPLSFFSSDDYDALVFPGGFGAAKNLSTYAFEGPGMHVNPEVANVIAMMHEKKKPIGGMCISPVILAKVIENAHVTIGSDKDTAADIARLNAKHENANHGHVIIDRENLLFTTPCYMLDASIVQVAEGAENLIKTLFKYLDEEV